MGNWRVFIKKNSGNPSRWQHKTHIITTPDFQRAVETVDAFCRHYNIDYEMGFKEDNFQQICYKDSHAGQLLLGYIDRE